MRRSHFENGNSLGIKEKKQANVFYDTRDNSLKQDSHKTNWLKLNTIQVQRVASSDAEWTEYFKTVLIEHLDIRSAKTDLRYFKQYWCSLSVHVAYLWTDSGSYHLLMLMISIYRSYCIYKCKRITIHNWIRVLVGSMMYERREMRSFIKWEGTGLTLWYFVYSEKVICTQCKFEQNILKLLLCLLNVKAEI